VRWHAAALGLVVAGHRGLRPVPWVLVDGSDRLAVGGHGPHDDVEYLALALVALLELPVAELFQRDKRVIWIVLRRVLLAVELRVGHSAVPGHLKEAASTALPGFVRNAGIAVRGPVDHHRHWEDLSLARMVDLIRPNDRANLAPAVTHES